MPADGKISLAWQIIMVILIPIAGIWAFYRIKRLQKAFLYIILPQTAITALVFASVFATMPDDESIDSLQSFDEPGKEIEPIVFAITMASSALGLGITALSIYLIIKWSEEWNRRFE